MSANSSYSSVFDLEDAIEVQYKNALVELEASRKRNVELEASIQELKEKMEKLEVDEENILTSIVGSWSIVSSIGMEEYIQKWRPNGMNDAIFQVATQHFEVDGDTVTMYRKIGTSERCRSKWTLGAKTGGFRMFVEDNKLVFVFINDTNEEEYMRVKRFVKAGKLHVVCKRFGLKCTRIYERTGAAEKETLRAKERILELEDELETLKVEKRNDKLTMEENTVMIQELEEELETAKKEYEEVDNELEELTEEMVELKEEKANIEEELRKEKESNVEISRKLNTQTNIAMDMRNKVKFHLMEKEVLKKRVVETEGKLNFAKGILQRIDAEKKKSEKTTTPEPASAEEKKDVAAETVPIQTAIIGTWRMKVVHVVDNHDLSLSFTQENGLLVETNTDSFTKFVWDLNKENLEVTNDQGHNFLRDNTLISKNNRMNGHGRMVEIKKRIENGLLIVEYKVDGTSHTPVVFERAV